MEQMKIKLYYDLMDIIQKQEEMIRQQNKLIIELVNENMEKENMINVLMQEQEGMYWYIIWRGD